jgi:hypothetical protein
MIAIPNAARHPRRALRGIAAFVLLLTNPIAIHAHPFQTGLGQDPKPPPNTPPVPDPPADPPDLHQGMEQESTRMQLRGFGDMQFHMSNERGTASTFTIGQLDLFITSQLAADLNVVSEVVFEADDDNHYTLDVERLLLQFSPSDYFNIGIGRYHTGIGFYNNAYHHGAWFQTALGRPLLFEFEDDDGILPVHGVGLTARGRIPSGRVGLRWLAEISNGRRYGDGEAVQAVRDDNGFKAVNVALLMRPQWVPGLQTGLSVYRDEPAYALGHVNQLIVAAHAVYQGGAFEQLNEVVTIRNTPDGSGATSTTTGLYTQLARRFGRLSPYFRYEHLSAPSDDVLFGQIGRISGPSVGARYDFRDLAALKVQWQRTTKRPGAMRTVDALAAQVAFTF